MHRFSPYSTRAIKGRKNGVKVKKKKKILNDNDLVNLLLEKGYSFEMAYGCISYLENKTLNDAIYFLEITAINLNLYN